MQKVNNWQLSEILNLFKLPFNDLLYKSHQVFRKNFDVNKLQLSSLINIKTGACPEDCSYCSQSSKYNTNIQREKLIDKKVVVEAAKKAQKQGSSRFCMGAAWRNPTDKNLDKVIEIIKEVKSIGMETCVTLGMLNKNQAKKLKDAGLDYYNHNIDTSEEHYSNVITSRKFKDRLDTLEVVSSADINVCSGGILGLGESELDRASMLKILANLEKQPQSVPINKLVPIEGTPMANVKEINDIDFVKTIAVARILLPKSAIRLSAGRLNMSDVMQALCFFAGANSVFYGDALLTTDNNNAEQDQKLLAKLGISS